MILGVAARLLKGQGPPVPASDALMSGVGRHQKREDGRGGTE